MQNKSNFVKIAVIILCVFFVAILVFSEAFTSEHNCTGKDCAVCRITQNAKFVFGFIVCALVSVVLDFSAPRLVQSFIKRDTLVSSKLKLTI